MCHIPQRTHVPNRTGPSSGSGSGSGGASSRLADTNATPFKGLLDLPHFENYLLSIRANSKLLGEVTRVPWLGIISKHLTSESSLGLRSDLGVDLEHLDSGSSRALRLRIFLSSVSLSQSPSLFWFVTFLNPVKANLRTCRVVAN